MSQISYSCLSFYFMSKNGKHIQLLFDVFYVQIGKQIAKISEKIHSQVHRCSKSPLSILNLIYTASCHARVTIYHKVVYRNLQIFLPKEMTTVLCISRSVTVLCILEMLIDSSSDLTHTCDVPT